MHALVPRAASLGLLAFGATLYACSTGPSESAGSTSQSLTHVEPRTTPDGKKYLAEIDGAGRELSSFELTPGGAEKQTEMRVAVTDAAGVRRELTTELTPLTTSREVLAHYAIVDGATKSWDLQLNQDAPAVPSDLLDAIGPFAAKMRDTWAPIVKEKYGSQVNSSPSAPPVRNDGALTPSSPAPEAADLGSFLCGLFVGTVDYILCTAIDLNPALGYVCAVVGTAAAAETICQASGVCGGAATLCCSSQNAPSGTCSLLTAGWPNYGQCHGSQPYVVCNDCCSWWLAPPPPVVNYIP